MNEELNIEKLTNIIAQEIRDKGLNEILSLEAVREKVLEKLNQPQGMQEMETPNLAQSPTQFPRPDEEEAVEDATLDDNAPPPPPAPETEKTSFVPGEQFPTETLSEPTAYRAPLQDMLKDVEPEKIIIFDMNELSEGGENLAAKPFKTMADPEIRRSMRDLWAEDGKTKAEVYVAKFEKLGEIDFDYLSGTARFGEKRLDPDFDVQAAYKENPYTVDASPKAIENAVDVEKAVKDAALELLKQAVLSNPLTNPLAQSAPVQESKKPIKENSITRKDITKSSGGYVKIDTPNAILEAVSGKNTTAKLVAENDEVSTWMHEDKEYYFLAKPISHKKCYSKTK